MEGPLVGLARYETALELASRRGSTTQGLWAKTERMEVLYQIGEWDRALVEADELIALGRNRIDQTLYAISHVMRSRILLLRGRHRDGTPAGELLELARPVEELQLLAPALAVAAMVGLAGGG